jgi:hypothetical protein
VGDIPLKTRVYALLLVLITVTTTAIASRVEYQTFPTGSTNLVIIAGLLAVMIVEAEVFNVSMPRAGQEIVASGAGAFCFAAGLTIGPVLGAIVVALAYLFYGVIARYKAIKTTVNAASMGLATIASAALYFTLADPAKTTIGSFQNLLAVLLAGTLSVLINSGSLAIIVAPVMAISPIELFRTTTMGLHVELVALAALGGVIPVLVNENPLLIIVFIVPILFGPELTRG